MKAFAALALAAALAVPAAHAQQKVIADKSFIRFALTQMGISVEGRFRKFDAAVAFDPAKPEATRGEFSVDLASIDLGTPESETEAKRKPWLDVQGFPQAKFTSASVKALGGGRFEARGPLTIKGNTHDIVAPFTVAESNGVRIVDGQFLLKRLQYKVGEGEWADTDTVADDITVHFRFALPLK
ncbi:MAG TPA: YceI family protein [Usitatibacter sp.]|jgi:polyisoprenoid-binding protein YceI|nr:YceI family protein [Usitatibacter sp.]